jgi:alpha-galactosidase/6-phospho-beta-glucosidase family protein
MMLAEWIGAPFNEIDYVCAGINHQAWYLEYKWNGKDAYPLIHKAVTERPEIYNAEPVRNEMYLALGKYVTESSGHNSEYNPWFRKRPDLIEKYCTHGTNWNPGEYAYILKEYQHNEATWQDQVKERSNGLLRRRPGAQSRILPHIINACRVVRCSSSMAMSATRTSLRICLKVRAWKCRSWWTKPASIRFMSARCRLNARC